MNMKRIRLIFCLAALAVLCGVMAAVPVFAAAPADTEPAQAMTKNIRGAEDVQGSFALTRSGDNLYLNIEITDPGITNVDKAAVQLLFLLGEAPAEGGFASDTAGGIYSFNFHPWLPATGPEPQNIIIPSDDQTTAHAGNAIFSTCVVNAPEVEGNTYRFQTAWVLKPEYAALLGDSIGFDIRYVNFAGEEKVLGWSSEEEALYDDLSAIGSISFSGETSALPSRDYAADAYSFSVAPVEGGIPRQYFSVPGGISQDSYFQAMWDGEAIYLSMTVADEGASGGGALDWVRFAIDFGGVPAESGSISKRECAGAYAFNLSPWLPNTGGEPLNYGGVTENGEAVLQKLDFSYIYYRGEVRLQMRLVPKAEYASYLEEGGKIGFTLQYNDNLATGNDGSASENFYVWGDGDGAIDNDLSAMGALSLVKNPNGVSSGLDELYTQPYFEGNTMLNESVMFIEKEDGSVPDAPLLYTPDKIISVRSSDLFTEYEEGRDYTVEGGKLRLTENSRIPVVAYEDYYPSEENGGWFGGTMSKVGGGYVAFRESWFFQSMQVAVTYEHSESWQGEEIYGKAELLPKTMQKLENGEQVKIVFLGDSVTEGANATGVIGAAPYADSWSRLTVSRLCARYGENAVLPVYDYARGGMDTAWGISQSVEVGRLNPDLVVIEFAGNEGTRSPELYAYNIEQMMRGVKRGNPDAEFILVSNFLPNPEAEMNAGVYENIPFYRDELLEMEGEGVAVADIYAAYTCLIQNKRFADMTGNNINHPNDFLSRLYAQIMLRTLSDENPLPEQPDGGDPGEEPGGENPGDGQPDPGPGMGDPSDEEGAGGCASAVGTGAAVLSVGALTAAVCCIKKRRKKE